MKKPKMRYTKYGYWEARVKPKTFGKMVEGIMDDYKHGRKTENDGARVREVTINLDDDGETTCFVVFDNNSMLKLIRGY